MDICSDAIYRVEVSRAFMLAGRTQSRANALIASGDERGSPGLGARTISTTPINTNNLLEDYKKAERTYCYARKKYV